MKKRVNNLFIVGLIFIFSLISINAEVCGPKISLINQDPYPAIPGEYVKLVFQVKNIENPTCGTISFELLEQYPLIFDPDTQKKITINSGFYKRDYGSFLIAPYKVRIDKEALKGDNPIDTKIYYSGNQGYLTTQFNIYVEDSKTDFEIHIDKYSYETKELTIEILNIGNSDIEALTLEVPKQENIDIRGTNRVVVGSLDANEYTTADFKANIQDGEIEIKILYIDSTGIRREVIKEINFDSTYFTKRPDEQQKNSTTYYIIILVIVIVLIWWLVKRKKEKKRYQRTLKGSAKL